MVGEQADLADAEVGEDLAAEAYLAEDALVGGAERFGFRAAGGAMDAEAAGCAVRSMVKPRWVWCR